MRPWSLLTTVPRPLKRSEPRVSLLPLIYLIVDLIGNCRSCGSHANDGGLAAHLDLFTPVLCTIHGSRLPAALRVLANDLPPADWDIVRHPQVIENACHYEVDDVLHRTRPVVEPRASRQNDRPQLRERRHV